MMSKLYLSYINEPKLTFLDFSDWSYSINGFWVNIDCTHCAPIWWLDILGPGGVEISRKIEDLYVKYMGVWTYIEPKHIHVET